jgi:mono/diheme cytochrome c family protein
MRRKFAAGLLTGLRVVWPILSALLGAIVTLGLVIGLLEGWSIPESIYFAFVSGLTIGYGDLAPKTVLARKARGLATPADAKTRKNPLAPTPLTIAEGRDHFADHCAVCHANTGGGKAMINTGLYPPAPDLRKDETQGLSDGELMYIIKNGIRFTGMPGWGGEDEENWKLVLFIRHLPHLTAQELALMTEVNGLQEETTEDDHSLAHGKPGANTPPEGHEHHPH